MQTIKELLSRIRWDPAFGGADFELGYWDRVKKAVIRVPLSSLEVGPDTASFTLIDVEGRLCNVPLHRVRCVWRDGELIWTRRCKA